MVFIVASQESLNAAIMWASYGGICLDSSWRHKNENVTPLTFLVTVDTNNKMIPSEQIISVENGVSQNCW